MSSEPWPIPNLANLLRLNLLYPVNLLKYPVISSNTKATAKILFHFEKLIPTLHQILLILQYIFSHLSHHLYTPPHISLVEVPHCPVTEHKEQLRGLHNIFTQF